MRVMIASPVFDGNVRAEYMSTVIGIMDLLASMGVERELYLRRGPLLHMNRNVIANRCLERGCTHLLGLDADIAFDPRVVADLLATDKEFQALAYPFKEIQPVPEGLDPRHLVSDPIAVTARYDLQPWVEDGKVTVTRGMIRARAVGTGAFMIKADVLERMIERKVAPRYRSPAFFAPEYAGEHCHGFFDYLRDGDDILGEDYSFSRRWVEGCGGEIWCRIDVPVAHIGPVRIVGCYEKKLASGAA